eukprot:2316425-Alexandrium_andersonii.AAC.1
MQRQRALLSNPQELSRSFLGALRRYFPALFGTSARFKRLPELSGAVASFRPVPNEEQQQQRFNHFAAVSRSLECLGSVSCPTSPRGLPPPRPLGEDEQEIVRNR